jgi:hypothetical protein
METSRLIFLVLFLLFIVSAFSMIGLAFYAGRARVKEIDKIAHGFEIPHDSIFFLVMRVPTYGFAFLWGWYAKRMGLDGKIDHFDRHFRWPFIAAAVCGLFGILMMIIMALFDSYAGIT